MASLVQQSSTTFFFGDNTAKSVSLTGVTTGNSIIVCASLYIYGGGSPSITANDGNAYTTDIQNVFSSGSDRPTAAIMRLHNVTSGSKTITVTIGGGIAAGNCNGSIRAYEVSGLANAAADKTTTGGGTSTSPSTGTTATLGGTAGFAIAALATTGTGASLPSGWTNLITTDGRQDYKIFSTSDGLQANWGTFGASAGWSGALAAYLDASATITGSGSPTSASVTLAGFGGITSPVLKPFISPVTSVRSGLTSISGTGTIG